MSDLTDPTIPKVTQEMMHYGTVELKAANILRPEAYADPGAILIAVSRIYVAMRRREMPVVPAKELFIIT